MEDGVVVARDVELPELFRHGGVDGHTDVVFNGDVAPHEVRGTPSGGEGAADGGRGELYREVGDDDLGGP